MAKHRWKVIGVASSWQRRVRIPNVSKIRLILILFKKRGSILGLCALRRVTKAFEESREEERERERETVEYVGRIEKRIYR